MKNDFFRIKVIFAHNF